MGGRAAARDRRPDYADARALGVRAVKALGLDTGFTHMEWFRRDDGSLAIGEIAARPPGAHIVLANSYAHDADMYKAWARAVVDDAFDGPFERKYAVGSRTCAASVTAASCASRASKKPSKRVGHLVVESRSAAAGTPRPIATRATAT